MKKNYFKYVLHIPFSLIHKLWNFTNLEKRKHHICKRIRGFLRLEISISPFKISISYIFFPLRFHCLFSQISQVLDIVLRSSFTTKMQWTNISVTSNFVDQVEFIVSSSVKFHPFITFFAFFAISYVIL